MKGHFTKAERKIIERYEVLHRFRVAKTPEEYNEAVAASKEYCQKYNIKFNKLYTFPELVSWGN